MINDVFGDESPGSLASTAHLLVCAWESLPSDTPKLSVLIIYPILSLEEQFLLLN